MKTDPPTWSVSESARALHSNMLVWDNHICLQHETDDRFLPEIERFRRAGVDAGIINAGFDVLPWSRTIRVIACMRRWFLARPEHYVLIQTAEDIRQAKRNGKMAIGFNIEGGCALAGQLSLLQLYADLGVRWMLLAYNVNNALGGGCHDQDCGLTDFGRRVVEEMASVGIILCCSHTGYETAMAAIEYSPNPVIFSHSNPRALADHPRNIPNTLIDACAQSGGVIGINGIGLFLGDVNAKTESLVRHIDYVVQRVGPEHVGIGLDFSVDSRTLDLDITKPSDYLPEGFSKFFPAGYGYEDGITVMAPEELPRVTERLLYLGYPEPAIRGIMGENLLRVADRVWKRR